MPGFVYILKSLKNDRYYVGSSENPDQRLAFHNSGKVKATKYLTPWERIALFEFPTMTEARKQEYKIKSMKSRKYIEELISVRAPR